MGSVAVCLSLIVPFRVSIVTLLLSLNLNITSMVISTCRV